MSMEIHWYSPAPVPMAYGSPMTICNQITVPTKTFIAAITSILKREFITSATGHITPFSVAGFNATQLGMRAG